MPEMIATSEIEYPPGKRWKPGDRFQVEEAHAKLLAMVGRAKFPEAEEMPPKQEPLPVLLRKRGRPPKAR
jgi:hypothetical protein